MSTFHRGYTFRIYPDRQQEVKLLEWIGVTRYLWNIALEQRISAYNRQYPLRKCDFYTQAAELKDIRGEFSWIKEYPYNSANIILSDLDKAYTSFFRQGGFPKFKSKNRDDASVPFSARDVKISKIRNKFSYLYFPKLKEIKFRHHKFHRLIRLEQSKLTNVRVYQKENKWYVSIGIKTDIDISINPNNGLTVGIDRGVIRPVQLSSDTNDYFILPERINELEKKYRKGQKKLKNKVRGSNRYKKQIARNAKLKSKQTRVRNHWQHQITNDIATKYDVVVLEKLNTKSMTKSAKGTKDNPGTNVKQKSGLNRSILNVGWFGIEQKLKYKCKEVVFVSPRNTSITCSSCGVVNKEYRESQSVFSCSCGSHINADYNAAYNIINRWSTPDVKQVKRRRMTTDELSDLSDAA